MLTAWQTPGMGRPCCVEVGERSAPVPQKRIFFSLPVFSLFNRSPHRVIALQPQPEPPEWTSCFVLSKTNVPQSVSFPPRGTPFFRASCISNSLPSCPKSPVIIRSKSSGPVLRSSKWAQMVLKAAGAMAAPMLLASLIPKSVTMPTVAAVTLGPLPSAHTRAAPEP